MRARLVQVIEVSHGGVRRYFTAAGEPIGTANEGVPVEPADAPPMSAEDVIAMVPRKRQRFVPPFNPGEIEAAKPGEVDIEVEG